MKTKILRLDFIEMYESEKGERLKNKTLSYELHHIELNGNRKYHIDEIEKLFNELKASVIDKLKDNIEIH